VYLETRIKTNSTNKSNVYIKKYVKIPERNRFKKWSSHMPKCYKKEINSRVERTIMHN